MYSMRQPYNELWRRLGVQKDFDSEFQFLCDAYAQSCRYYHNAEHIQSCLKDFQQVSLLTETPDWIECAIWYHDIVYDVHCPDNEQKSADLAVAVCQKAGLSSQAMREIHDLILITKHDRTPATINEQIITDVDLAILGKPPEVYAVYEKAIRKEYSHVQDSDFQMGRTAILHAFLDRPSIYSLDYFKERYQQQAINNIQNEILSLESR